jgi:excisionase family DNA binding protein
MIGPAVLYSVSSMIGKWRFDRRSRIGIIQGMIAMMKDDTGRKMLTCREAAEKYGCSMRYIRKLAKDGEIRSETVAGSYMVAEADVASRKAKVAKGKGRHKPKASKFRPG